jgi:hypothetical protein
MNNHVLYILHILGFNFVVNIYLEASRLAHVCVRVQFPAIKKIIWYIFNIRVGVPPTSEWAV